MCIIPQSIGSSSHSPKGSSIKLSALYLAIFTLFFPARNLMKGPKCVCVCVSFSSCLSHGVWLWFQFRLKQNVHKLLAGAGGERKNNVEGTTTNSGSSSDPKDRSQKCHFWGWTQQTLAISHQEQWSQNWELFLLHKDITAGQFTHVRSSLKNCSEDLHVWIWNCWLNHYGEGSTSSTCCFGGWMR